VIFHSSSLICIVSICLDVGCFQISTHSKTNLESQTRSFAVVRVKAIENANKIFGSSVAQVKYENNECHLSESASSAER